MSLSPVIMRALRRLLLLTLAAGTAAFGQGLDLDMDTGGDALGMLDGGLDMSLEENPAAADLAGLAQTCVLPIHKWAGVRPKPRRGSPPDGDWAWHVVADDWASPVKDRAVTTRVTVPADGSYRVFLRLLLPAHAPLPVTLSIHPIADGQAAPTPSAQHTFGATKLNDSWTGAEHEKKRPLRFESEPERLGMVNEPTPVWEYQDIELTAGDHELRLQSTIRRAKIGALVITQAKAFSPSQNVAPDYNTLSNIYLRFRIREAKGAPTHSIYARLTYHWRGRSLPGSSEPIWGWQIGDTGTTTTGEWSEFVDATEAMIPGPGPWSTCNLTIQDINAGILDIQAAWRPHPAAVMRTIETRTQGGVARFRVPHGLGLGVDGRESPTWGVWEPKKLDGFVGEGDVVERYFNWADAAMQTLAVAPDHPRLERIIFNATARTTPYYNTRAAQMLARLGINWVEGAPAPVKQEYDLIDGWAVRNTDAYQMYYDRDPTRADTLLRAKIGDEIHTAVPAGVINAKPDLIAGFHDYLRQLAAENQMDVNTYIGSDDLSQIRAISELPPYPGIYERRLYYASQRYSHLASIPYYKRVTEGYHRLFPNVEVYNNYSPHPLFLTGTTMNHIDWFVLARNEAQTLAWGEDWATGGGWGLGTRYQCTSFYAAIVAAAARRHGYPSGFYVGSNCGGSAQKLYACLGQGLTRLHTYAWGPIDAWAEGSNSWSEQQSQYLSIATAAYSLGPADEIIGDGTRLPSRVAVLYNRSHEIWQEGTGRMNHDWMWTYIASFASAEPVDVVIEDDIPEHLSDYRVLFLGGYNLDEKHVASLRDWVADGRLLVLSGGGAMLNLSNDPNDATIDLAGVRQSTRDSLEKDTETVTFTANGPVPAGSFQPIMLRGQLEPTTATVVATWSDGSPAATLQPVGQGHVLTLGFQPGFAYRQNGQADGPVRDWLEGLLRAVCGPPTAELDFHASEATTYVHEKGIAVMLASFGGDLSEPTTLTVRPDRAISSVQSGLRGDLPFERDGDAIIIQVPPLKPVDTIILR